MVVVLVDSLEQKYVTKNLQVLLLLLLKYLNLIFIVKHMYVSKSEEISPFLLVLHRPRVILVGRLQNIGWDNIQKRKTLDNIL